MLNPHLLGEVESEWWQQTPFEAINLSQWIAGNPADVLAVNFAQPPELFGKFPKHEVFIASASGPDKWARSRN
jgi:oxalate decarboxylase